MPALRTLNRWADDLTKTRMDALSIDSPNDPSRVLVPTVDGGCVGADRIGDTVRIQGGTKLISHWTEGLSREMAKELGEGLLRLIKGES